MHARDTGTARRRLPGLVVEGPKGFLGHHGRTPGCTQLVRACSRVLRLRVVQVVRVGAEILVGRSPG